MDIQVDSSNDLNDAQIDALLNEETPSANIPMKDQPAPSPWTEDVIKVNGKEIKAPREQILQWAQLGHGHPQKAQEYNQMKSQVDAWTKRQAELDERENKWKPYKEVDEFATKNPEWWQQVQESYKQKINGAQTSPEIQQLRQELAELKQFKDQLETKEKSQMTEAQDKQLTEDIMSLRKSYPNIDFDSPDDSGKSLEYKILEHADKMGLDGNKPGAFRIAFRDFYHDHLVNKAKEEGKELVAKDVQKRTKLGILGETSKPTKGLKVATSVKDKSYNDLLHEALDELKHA